VIRLVNVIEWSSDQIDQCWWASEWSSDQAIQWLSVLPLKRSFHQCEGCILSYQWYVP
jgi:hypothetical protein